MALAYETFNGEIYQIRIIINNIQLNASGQIGQF
jgi:hypothetical protein